jgi:hypothetical protein
MTIYEVIRRPLVTEKGVEQKDNTAHSALKWRWTPIKPR